MHLQGRKVKCTFFIQSIMPYKSKQVNVDFIPHPFSNSFTSTKFLRFVDEYKKNGVPMWGMTIFNEPFHQWPYVMGFNNMTIEREFLNSYLGPALAKAGYTKNNFKLMMFDEGTGMPQPGKPDNPNSIVNVVDLFMNVKDTKKYISGKFNGTSSIRIIHLACSKGLDITVTELPT